MAAQLPGREQERGRGGAAAIWSGQTAGEGCRPWPKCTAMGGVHQVVYRGLHSGVRLNLQKFTCNLCMGHRVTGHNSSKLTSARLHHSGTQINLQGKFRPSGLLVFCCTSSGSG